MGTSTWTTAYSLTFVSGDRMGGVDTLLPQTVVPGQTVDIGVNLTAPSLGGSYRGYWELKNASGAVFGIGTYADKPFWVAINVSGVAAASATPTLQGSTPATATRTAGPTASATPTATTSATTGWSTYLNARYGFSFQIPPGSTITSQTDTGGRVYLPFAAGTTLLDKYLNVSVAEGVSPCVAPGSNPNVAPTTAMFNGIPWLKQTWVEGATSHMGSWTAYSYAKDNACISLSFLLWSVSNGPLPTPLPEYDPAAESVVFTQIMSSYMNR